MCNNLEKFTCLVCDSVENTDNELLLHLFGTHQLIVESVADIPDKKRYFSYWRQRFQTVPYAELLPSVRHTESRYYILSDLQDEDAHVRRSIRLDDALKQQEFERDDMTFRRPCFFCRKMDQVVGRRSTYVRHLAYEHNMQLGRPENLVFLDDLFGAIERQLDDLQCLYCQRKFPNWLVLKEHMRKKGHKRLNPHHKQYDRHYMVSYTEGRGQEHQESAQAHSDDDDEFADWQQEEKIQCLFCAHVTTTTILDLNQHMIDAHKFQFPTCVDYYIQVKCVNYIRRMIDSCQCPYCQVHMTDVERHLDEMEHCKLPDNDEVYNRVEYYTPTWENDSFLYYLDDLKEVPSISDK